MKLLVANCKTSHEAGGLLELNEWKSLDHFETDDDTLDVWNASKDWRVDMDMEEGGWDSSAWSVTDV